ncbi:MAG TPA: hypothetical protein VNK70_00575 [Candidatus Paceibacterota bacterium]|nr:hypothetical protein [Candidatus Paceibacterota bacterium]
MKNFPNFESGRNQIEDRLMTTEEVEAMEKEISDFVGNLSDLEKAGLVKVYLGPSNTEGFSTVTVKDTATGEIIFYEDFGVTYKVLDTLSPDVS